MKLKSLLLGSAASLMAVTSSFAADAVVAEPEAVEYVRVCDAYGAGYFYIPGTERCLRLSGEVRFEYRIEDRDAVRNAAGGLALDPATGNAIGIDDTDAEWAYRARFAVESANESDFGTIKTYIRMEANYGDPNGNGAGLRSVGLQAMTLSIGGLEVGIFDNYWTKNNGYGNLFAMNDGYYGYDQALYAQYTYEVAGFAVTAGVEQTLNDVAGVFNAAGVATTAPVNYSGDELNLYAGANYGGSWGSVAGTIYYDNFRNEVDYKVSALVKPLEGLQIKAWYLGGDGIYSQQAGGLGVTATGATFVSDYAYGISAAYTFGDFTPYVGYSDAEVNAGVAVVGVVWAPSSADGLKVQLEGNFATEDTAGFVTRPGAAGAPAVTAFENAGSNNAYRLRLIKTF